MYPQFRRGHLAAAVLFASSSLLGGQALAEDERLEELDERAESVVQLGDEVVLGTAEQELKQAPGVSIITAEDIRKRPPVNDLSEIIRTMPGVNLTGNSSSGQRGNNRQIDIRGMGPENTLILVDGKPVSSRNSVRYGWRGERDTRGDSNWVPPEEVERIEVLRGPSAARYGSGAAGGVVNIITKRPTDRLRGSMTVFTNIPESSKDGATRRANFSLSGPLTEALSFRAYGSANKTDSDDTDINLGHTVNPSRTVAGREGVRNRDLSGMLSWQVTPPGRRFRSGLQPTGQHLCRRYPEQQRHRQYPGTRRRRCGDQPHVSRELRHHPQRDPGRSVLPGSSPSTTPPATTVWRRGWPVPSRGRSAPTVRSAPASWRTIASAANSTFRCMRCSSRC